MPPPGVAATKPIETAHRPTHDHIDISAVNKVVVNSALDPDMKIVKNY